MKNKIIYIILILIIIFSFTIPKIITKLQDNKILSNNYTINEEIYTLSENTKQIKLINNIYSKYNINKYEVSVSDMLQSSKNIIQIIDENIQINNEEEVLTHINELVKRNIINKRFYEMFHTKYIIYRTWKYNNGEITYSKIKIFTNNDYENAIASIEIEHETNKVIAFTVRKEYTAQNQNNLQEYIKYLELDKKFTDWEYKKNELISKSAGVKVTTLDDGKYISYNLQINKPENENT